MKLKEKVTNFKGKNFFKKVDPISFALVALLGVTATFAISNLTWSEDTPVVYPNVDGTDDATSPVGVTNPLWLEETVISPLTVDEIAVTTTFFDPEADSVDAVVSSIFAYRMGRGFYTEQSRGTSFRDYDNEVADVVSILSGVVSNVHVDEILRGTIVTIDHENGAQSIFTGLYNSTVAVGDQVSQGTVLGTTGLSQVEPDAGNVVHLEFILNGENLNPEDVIDQRLGDL